MLKENYEKVENDLYTLEKNYTRFDFVDMIEISYILSNKEEMKKFNELIEFAFDGVNLYGLFVKFLYDKFSKTNDLSIYEFVTEENVRHTIEEFKNTYFEEA